MSNPNLDVVIDGVTALNKGFDDLVSGDPARIELHIGHAEKVLRALYDMRLQADSAKLVDIRPYEVTEAFAALAQSEPHLAAGHA